MSLSGGYFDRLYADSPDPWGFTDRWYEQRKRAVTLAALPAERYACAYEPGCSVGVLTEALADRCDDLLASDVAEQALAQARARLAGREHVRLEQHALPGDWPAGSFDLVVLSEFLYYFNDADLAEVARLAVAAVSASGTLLAVHWLHPVEDYPQSGAHAQEVVAAAATGLIRTVRHREADFDLAVYVRPQPGEDTARLSVAARQGLC